MDTLQKRNPELLKDLQHYQETGLQRDERDRCLINALLNLSGQLSFPVQVFPSVIQEYIVRWSGALGCSVDLLAVPLLSIAGAAIGRSGCRLQVNESWTESSCLWTAAIASSGDGKTPALSATANFYVDHQTALMREWEAECRAIRPRPTILLTDTTVESLRADMVGGALLYMNDELSGWCTSMNQYKVGNSDRPAWTSFWSHAAVNVGRCSGRLWIESPFVAVTGMLVPEMAYTLNYRGTNDDGFVHRMLICAPNTSPMVAVPLTVPTDCTTKYKATMTKLFQPGGKVTVDHQTYLTALQWVNDCLYSDVSGLGVPGWKRAKYRKLWNNLWRVALVLHELRRAAGEAVDPAALDRQSLDRAITVIYFFRDHLARVQTHLGREPEDDLDGFWRRFRSKGVITVRDFAHSTSVKKADKVLNIFTCWERRGYGKIEPGDRVDQKRFRFNERKADLDRPSWQ